MALPIVRTLTDCSDYTKTVQPYLPQLKELPYQLLQAWSNPTELRNIYISTNPLISGLALSLFLAPIFLIVSEINKNYSQVDRCWSILPTIYNAHFVSYAHLSGLPTQRLDNILAFSVLWSLRLTFNYWRKGGYSIGSEDYRWQIVQDWCKSYPGVFFVFNVTFISFIQSLLLLAIATPTYTLLLASRFSEKMSITDTVFARSLMALIVVEFFADNQQWNYQSAKSLYRKTAKVPQNYKHTRSSLDLGFLTTGLWRFSCHPNFAAEQAIWVLLYQWSCVSTNVIYNWTSVGVISLMAVFQGSTWLTELITARKYPEYPVYQERVGKFLPKVFGRGVGDLGREMEQIEGKHVDGKGEGKKAQRKN